MIKFWITLVSIFCGALGTLAQQKKFSLDGSGAIGWLAPQGDHAYKLGMRRSPLMCADNGYSLQVDAHGTIGGGWKFGFHIADLIAQMDESAMQDYFLSSIDTTGFFLSVDDNSERATYETERFAFQIANDIKAGRFIITPKFNLGLALFSTSYNASFHLKQKGANYEKDVTIRSSDNTSMNFSMSPGVKVGYSFNFFDDMACVYLMADWIKFSPTAAFNISTQDIHDNTTSTIQLYNGEVEYLNLGIGISYYLE
jgi:hypothetical protein